VLALEMYKLSTQVEVVAVAVRGDIERMELVTKPAEVYF
jgi:hypothetical protein